MAARTPFDIVQVEFSWLAHYVFPPGAAVIVDEHNLEYEVPQRTAEVASGTLRGLYAEIDHRKLRREEERTWNDADAVAVTSDRDAAVVSAAAPKTLVSVVPNAVDTEYFSPGTADRDPWRLLFFGTISYYPNTDALLFFLQEVFPTLKRRHPRLRLEIVGHAPPPEITRFASDDVSVVGAVDDVRPFLARAAAVIAPLRIGGGTRLKILEAMAMATPVVATTRGAEGLAVTPGRDILVADEPTAIADAVSALVTERDRAAALAHAGRALVETRYDWRHSAARLEDLYAAAIAAKHGAARTEVVGARRGALVAAPETNSSSTAP